MNLLKKVHHIAIICSDYKKSKAFYSELLGLQIIREVYRADRKSYKLDLSLNGTYIIELFSFPDPPSRPTQPEALGLRHLAFEVENIDEVILYLQRNKVSSEPTRIDEFTGRKFTFIEDPDRLPIEFYESN